jgi:predicted amidohydrolase YtcJ
LERHEPADVEDLWRYGSLLAAGVATVASSDAPYGDSDPWATMRAARDRTTPSGTVLGAAESVPASRSLAGFLAPLDLSANTSRRIHPGVVADLVLLKVPLAEALAEPTREAVAATVSAGRVVYRCS